MVIIIFMSQRTMLKTPSTCLEHDRRGNGNVFEHFEKKGLIPRIKVSSEYSGLIFASLFGSLRTPFLLEYNPIGVPYGPRFFLTELNK